MNMPFLNKTKKNQTAADAYFQEGEQWGQEMYQKAKESEARAWKLVWLMGGITALSVLAVLFLTPLKTVESHVYAVDKTTGFMEKMDTVASGNITVNEAVVRSEIVRFLQAHEIWDPTDFQERATFVRLNSDDRVYQFYLDAINKRAETMDYEDKRTVHIKSISLNTTEGTAFVRFSTDTTIDQNVREEHWVASVEYQHTSTPPDREIAFINPLGFQVTRFRVDQENVRESSE